jgi:hypothetical protein
MFFFVPFNFYILTLLMCTRITCPAATSGESPAGGSGPQPAPSSSAESPAATLAAPPSPPASAGARHGGSELETTPREVESASQEAGNTPQDEAAPSVAAGREPVATAAPGATVEPPSIWPAAEEAAAMVEAAAVEVAEGPSSDPQPAQEDVSEVVYRRRLLPKPVKVPFPCLMVKAQWVMEEMEAGLRYVWEELEAERHRLAYWEHRLGERIEAVTSRNAEERAQLEQERDVLHEKMRSTLDREAAVAQREKAVIRREKAAIERELEVEERAKAARDMINHTRAAAKLIEEQRAVLQEKELAVVEEKASVAARWVELATRAQDLKEREAALQEREMAFQEREAKMEELLAERSAGIDRFVRWVGEANPTLDSLGLSPIQVAEAPPSLGAVLPALESTAERLRRMESTILDRLEIEGRVVARVMTEYVLTYFCSHDPAIPLSPVLVGPVRETVAAAREGVQEAADIVVSRIKHLARTDLPTEGTPSDYK